MRHSVPYLLIGSLPIMPDLDRATVLPLSEDSFGRRLSWLHGSDAALLLATEDILRTDERATAGIDALAVDRFERYREEVQPGPMTAVVSREWERRSVLAALRTRGAGLAPPEGRWCPGPWAGQLRRNWSDPSFGSGRRLPWLADVRARLEAGHAGAVHRSMMRLLWDDLAALRLRAGFTLDSVIAYRLQWRILAQRLGEDAAATRITLDTWTRRLADSADLTHA